jgi:hypothetical protein
VSWTPGASLSGTITSYTVTPQPPPPPWAA